MLLFFSAASGKLRVTEVLLGDKAQCVSVTANLKCKVDYDLYLACCSLGQHILIMGGKRGGDSFAVLMDIVEAKRHKSPIQITKPKLKGEMDWSDWPFLSPVSESRALLYFAGRNSMWYCDVTGKTLTRMKLVATMPVNHGFYTVPVRLPSGKLLVAGASPYSNGITAISPDDESGFEKIGEIPGEARRMTSTVLIGEQFLLGFGGWKDGSLADLWIFDLQTHRDSHVRREGNWHPADELVPLVVQDDSVYLVSGEYTSSIHSLSFCALASLVKDLTVRSAFCHRLDVPFQPRWIGRVELLQSYVPAWL